MSRIKGQPITVGERFGRLVVLELAERKNGRKYYLCQCDCGNTTVVANTQLSTTRSCGCLFKEVQLATVTKHGKRYEKAYETWCGIKKRCFNSNTKSYFRYGGRGISVCPEWKDDFQAFYDYVSALPHFGEDGYSLDRINNDGNYEPNNVRWATRKEQGRNTSQTHFIEFNGERRSMKEWSEITGLCYSTIKRRAYRGLPPEEILKIERKGARNGA